MERELFPRRVGGMTLPELMPLVVRGLKWQRVEKKSGDSTKQYAMPDAVLLFVALCFFVIDGPDRRTTDGGRGRDAGPSQRRPSPAERQVPWKTDLPTALGARGKRRERKKGHRK